MEPKKEKTEEELVNLACRGDLPAFEELVRRYMRWAYSLAYSLSNDHYWADEISQEAFVALHRSIAGFRRKSSLKTYLYRIILNSWKQHLRKSYRKKRLSYALGRRVEKTRDIFDEMNADEIKGKIHYAVAQLPPRQKEVFVLKHLQGLKIAEVASTIGCSEGTVKANLFKALNNLRNRLK